MLEIDFQVKLWDLVNDWARGNTIQKEKAVVKLNALVENAILSGEGVKYEDGKPGNEYCDNCDGCGWHEGGPTLQTKCEKCDGEGIIKAKSAERKGTA